MTARRGPYRKPSNLTVSQTTWKVGDVVIIGSRRWIIRSVQGEQVVLTASNTSNYDTRWTTTLAHLPKKEPRT